MSYAGRFAIPLPSSSDLVKRSCRGILYCTHKSKHLAIETQRCKKEIIFKFFVFNFHLNLSFQLFVGWFSARILCPWLFLKHVHILPDTKDRNENVISSCINFCEKLCLMSKMLPLRNHLQQIFQYNITYTTFIARYSDIHYIQC